MSANIDDILAGLRELRSDLIDEARGDKRREADRQERAGRARSSAGASDYPQQTLPPAGRSRLDPERVAATKRSVERRWSTDPGDKYREYRRKAANRWMAKRGANDSAVDRIFDKGRTFKILGDKRPRREPDADARLAGMPAASNLQRIKLLTKREPDRRDKSDRDKNLRDRIAREVGASMDKRGISRAGRPPTKLPAIAKQYGKLVQAIRTGKHAAQQGQEQLQAKRRRGGAPKTKVKAGPKRGKGRKAGKIQQNLERGGKSQHGAGSGSGGRPGRGGKTKKGDPGFGPFDKPYDPDRLEDSKMYVAGNLSATGLYEDVLAEASSTKMKRQARRVKKLRRQGKHDEADRLEAIHKSEAPGGKGKGGKRARLPRFREMRAAGKLKGHKALGSKTKKSKSSGQEKTHGKYSNETTFKKCPEGAMISSPHLRHRIPKDRFVNPDDDNPTWPIRPGCRASLGGVTRALQYADPNKATKEQVISRINKLGGVRGKARFKAWGTRVGGQRFETHRGPPGAPKRHKSYGTSTGERDARIHTDQDTDRGPGNREVPRAKGAGAKAPKLVKSKRSQKRREAGERAGIARGKLLIDKGHEIPSKLTKSPKLDAGAALAKKFAKKKKKKKK